LEHALANGFHGAMIGTQPRGAGGNLDDPDLNPFWETASAKHATLFLHPMFVCGDDRLSRYDLVNGAGRLTDTTIAVSRLLFSGHLSRYPGVNLVLSHGGAALPFVLGRLKRNHQIHPDYADPAREFRRLYFDTCFSSRAPCASFAMWRGPIRSCSVRIIPFPSATRNRCESSMRPGLIRRSVKPSWARPQRASSRKLRTAPSENRLVSWFRSSHHLDIGCERTSNPKRH